MKIKKIIKGFYRLSPVRPYSKMINPFYLSHDFVKDFSAAFRSRVNYKFPDSPGASVDSAVFPVAVWPSFLTDRACISLRDELARMSFVLRSSDLYEFHQTVDLKHINPLNNPLISGLCKELYSTEFVRVMETVTGRRLGSHVDISGQRYQQGDFLLCHDDRIEKRRIALVLYLVEKEATMQGGRLFALRSNEEGLPVMDAPQVITPQWNTLAFFEVSRFSFHQVEQVFSEKFPRYSITCWFHDSESEQEIDAVPENQILSSLFPIKFSCPPIFSVKSLLKDIETLSHPVLRQYACCRFLSSAQYASDLEPRWIASLMTDSFHRLIERITGWNLDWPTKPVAWVLNSSDHFFYSHDDLLNRQHDVEYNYKDRSVSFSSTSKKLHFSLVIRLRKGQHKHMKPLIKLHLEPMSPKKIPKKYSEIIIISMKFNKSLHNQRKLK